MKILIMGDCHGPVPETLQKNINSASEVMILQGDLVDSRPVSCEEVQKILKFIPQTSLKEEFRRYWKMINSHDFIREKTIDRFTK